MILTAIFLFQNKDVPQIEAALIDLSIRHSPGEKSYEPFLQAHNIKRQAWLGMAKRSYGNHIRRALEPKVWADIARAPLKIVQQRCQSLLSVAEVVSACCEKRV